MSYWFFLDTHISIGGVVIEVFENAVGPLINTSLHLADREYLRGRFPPKVAFIIPNLVQIFRAGLSDYLNYYSLS